MIIDVFPAPGDSSEPSDGDSFVTVPGGDFVGTLYVGADGSNLVHTGAEEGQLNTYVGLGAGTDNTTGFNNTGVGTDALSNTTTGSYNTALGSRALFTNTTGQQNTAVGNDTLYNNTSGIFNTGFGWGTLFSNTTGSQNTAFGGQTMFANTTGSSNVTFGYSALNSNTTGDSNVAVGRGAMFYHIDGSQNIAIGRNSGFNPLDADEKYRVISDTNMIVIGYGARKNNAATLANGIAIGFNAEVFASNQVSIGNIDVTSTLLHGHTCLGSIEVLGWTNSSDADGTLVAAIGKRHTGVVEANTGILGTLGWFIDSGHVFKSAGQTATNATLADDTHLTVNLQAGRTYGFQFMMLVQASTAPNDGVRISLNGTATSSLLIADVAIKSHASTPVFVIDRITAYGSAVTHALVGTTDATVEIIGTIAVTNAGTFRASWAKSTTGAAVDTHVLAGSWLRVWEVIT